MGSRFLNKRFTVQDGFSKGPDDDSPAMFFDDSQNGRITRPLRINDTDLITAIWQTIYTWNVGAITPGLGSVNAFTSVDAAMSGAAIGDLILAAAIGSIAIGLQVQGFCISANNVSLRAQYQGTTGAYTPGNIPFKIVCIKLTA